MTVTTQSCKTAELVYCLPYRVLQQAVFVAADLYACGGNVA